MPFAAIAGVDAVYRAPTGFASRADRTVTLNYVTYQVIPEPRELSNPGCQGLEEFQSA
jgi:hypothetical protein